MAHHPGSLSVQEASVTGRLVLRVLVVVLVDRLRVEVIATTRRSAIEHDAPKTHSERLKVFGNAEGEIVGSEGGGLENFSISRSLC
jgi:hypothetical protein